MRWELDRGVTPWFYIHEYGLEPSEAATMMTVVELARQVGVTPDTVRHYLRLGLLQPQ